MLRTMTDSEIAEANEDRRRQHDALSIADKAALGLIIGTLRTADNTESLESLVRDYANGVLPVELEP